MPVSKPVGGFRSGESPSDKNPLYYTNQTLAKFLGWLTENDNPQDPAQRLDRQPGFPQVGLAHRDRRLAQRLGDAVVVPEHLGGTLRVAAWTGASAPERSVSESPRLVYEASLVLVLTRACNIG